jgi:hypothetical protein
LRAPAKPVVAAFAGLALVLQAMLASLTPPGAASVTALERISAYVICIGSPSGRDDADRPAPLPHRAHKACCILCTVPGLDPTASSRDLGAPAWTAPLAAPLRHQADAHFARIAERHPVRARAPPRA